MSNQPPHKSDGTAKPTTKNVPALSTKDLFELASLDALGILDEHERRQFEEGFAAASPAVQSQVRAQQSIMAEIDELLPKVTPPASLRDRVINAVLAAISATKAHPPGRSVPTLLASRGVNRFWRAGAIGLAAAAVALGVMLVQMQTRFREIEMAMRVNATTELFIKDFGSRFETALLDRKTQFVQFSPARPDAPAGSAVVLFNPETQTAHLYGKDLPTNLGSYRLVVLDADGNEREAVLTFAPSGNRFSDEAKVDLSGAKQLAITTVSKAGEPVQTLLRSNNL